MCRRDDYPPYPEPGAGEIRAALDAPDASAPAGTYNGWRTRATWSAWSWLSGDEMLFRLARTRVREIELDPRYADPKLEVEAVADEAVHLLRTFGGPLANREIEIAGGYGAIDRRELAVAIVELFDGDDRQ